VRDATSAASAPQDQVLPEAAPVSTEAAPLRRNSSGTRLGARWTAQLAVPVTGVYHFSLDVTGVGRLWVNNQLIIDVNANERTALGEGQIQLTAGQPAIIRVESIPFDLTRFGIPLVLAHATLGALTPADPDPVVEAAAVPRRPMWLWC
jgi:PA14 domain